MDLTQLKTFVTVAEIANLTKAAEVLCLSPPAISAQIKALEQELGVVLFQRTARGMTLTSSGETLREDAIKALDAAKSVIFRAQSLQKGLSGVCRIGTVSEPVILRLGELLSRMTQVHPNLSLHLSQSISGVVIEQVLDGRLDGGYVIGPVEDPRLAALPVRPVALRIVAPYAWKDRILTADWAQLAQQPWLLMSDKCSLRGILAGMFARHGLVPRGTVALDQESTLRRLVGQGLGLALMREDLAREGEAAQELVLWPKAVETSQLTFISLHAEASSPLIQALCQSVREIWELTEPLRHPPLSSS